VVRVEWTAPVFRVLACCCNVTAFLPCIAAAAQDRVFRVLEPWSGQFESLTRDCSLINTRVPYLHLLPQQHHRRTLHHVKVAKSHSLPRARLHSSAADTRRSRRHVCCDVQSLEQCPACGWRRTTRQPSLSGSAVPLMYRQYWGMYSDCSVLGKELTAVVCGRIQGRLGENGKRPKSGNEA
jgi:hypothetical protein